MSAAEDATLTFSSAQPSAEVRRRVMLNNCWPRCVGTMCGAEEMKASISADILVCKSVLLVYVMENMYQSILHRLRGGV